MSVSAPLFAVLALTACAHGERTVGVDALLENRDALDGRVVRVRGVLDTDGVGYNLTGVGRMEDDICVGLLLTRSQRVRLLPLNGSEVTVEGRFEKEGCGDGRLCFHTCRNAVTRVDRVSAPAPGRVAFF